MRDGHGRTTTGTGTRKVTEEEVRGRRSGWEAPIDRCGPVSDGREGVTRTPGVHRTRGFLPPRARDESGRRSRVQGFSVCRSDPGPMCAL